MTNVQLVFFKVEWSWDGTACPVSNNVLFPVNHRSQGLLPQCAYKSKQTVQEQTPHFVRETTQTYTYAQTQNALWLYVKSRFG